MEFHELVVRACGHTAYPFQAQLAAEGLPDLLEAPTGSGKTLAAVLPWLWRRRYHPDPSTRASTPRRLVVVLPQRALVEQTADVVAEWLARLGLADEVPLRVLMGGMDRRDHEWQLAIDRDSVLIGTQDMILSRGLMRGYAEARAAWPVSFGLLHNDSQFVFDEVQLMGPALPTSLQLEGLRRAVGTALPSRSMWMSATLDRGRLGTPDLPVDELSTVGLTDGDRTGPLGRRLAGTRTVTEVKVSDSKSRARTIAAWLLDHHRGGTRTIAVLNTVARAQELYDELRRVQPAAVLVLLHSRFRPDDRARHLERALAEPSEAGTLVVTTQVLEAGIDVDSHLLLTEIAPWSSIVQRAGRCNRSGSADEAVLAWFVPPPGRGSTAPYDEKDLQASAAALRDLDGQPVTSTELQRHPVDEQRPLHAVLRRRDLIDLFDTSPDLSGNDIDISRWVRDADATTMHVAWRAIHKQLTDDAPATFREELCPVPLGELRGWLSNPKRRGVASIYDQAESRWRTAEVGDVRPGAVLVLDASAGGYDSERGWSTGAASPVQPVTPEVEEPDGLASDPLTRVGKWVTLAQHLEDVRNETAALLERLGAEGLTTEQRQAAVSAAALHDLGKAHEVFASSLAAAGPAPDDQGGPWAKSGGGGRLRHSRPAFRHELVSALMVLHPASGLLEGEPEPDLIAYLVAAHHGKVRLAIRSAAEEPPGSVLGARSQDEVPAVELADGRTVPALKLHPEALLTLGADRNRESWTARTCRLRDRADLGPFRLGFLEAVVRLADWRASASYGEPS